MRSRKNMSTLDGIGPMAMRSHASGYDARVTWLMDRLAERQERREVVALLEELMSGPSGPGQIELAIAELATHPDPSGRVALQLWNPSRRDHVELRAACLASLCP